MKKSEVIAALSALAQESRLDIVRFLVAKGPDGAPAGVIGAKVGIPSPTLAFHLKTLADGGLVSRQRLGRQIIYRAEFAKLHTMVGYLLEKCCAEADAAGTRGEALDGDAA